jgi:hypothetical protein
VVSSVRTAIPRCLRHQRLIAALAEFQACGETSDSVLGSFGLAIVYNFSLESGIVTVTATLNHSEGAWLRCHVPCPGLTIEQLPLARDMARCMVLGHE